MASHYMMATKATHVTGDISREKPSLCYITGEDEKNFIGSWVIGFGFVDVEFPKSSTRVLTPEEKEEFNGRSLLMNGRSAGRVLIE